MAIVSQQTRELYQVAFEKLARSLDDHPVPFDGAWQWVGYSTKGNAKASLTNKFIKDVDYIEK